MSGEMSQSSSGLSSSDDASDKLAGRAVPPSDDSLPEPAALASSPPFAGSGTSSADELALSPGQISPDPYLDEFRPEPAPVSDHGVIAGAPKAFAAPTGPWAREALDVDLDVPPSAEITAVEDSPFGVSALAADLDLDTTGRKAATSSGPAETSPPSTSERFASLDLYAPPASKAESRSARKKQAKQDEEAAFLDEDEDEPQPARSTNWLSVLHTSLTSALAIGLIWVVWGKRVARESATVEPDPFPPAESSSDPGHRAGQSRKLVALEPLPENRIIALGQTIAIDSLEVTPLKILAGPVILRHAINKPQARRGGNDALILKIRLKNLSRDLILVPLDEAFIRTRGRGIRDSFIEAGPSRQIEMFPLAIVSEWAIAGQDFRELKPGESYETMVVSAPKALGDVTPDMTWRLRLRTDINQTSTVGIRFHDEDIRKISPRETPELAEEPDSGDTDTPTGASVNSR
jgi:hypothetical protein